MSSRISASLSLDTQGFTAGITKAEAETNRFAAKLRARGVGLFSGKSAQESAGNIGQLLAAQEKLEAVRQAGAFARLSDEAKAVALENELVAAKVRVASIEGITTEKIALQLRIEERSLMLEQIRSRLAQQRQAAASAAASAAQREAAARRETQRRAILADPAGGGGGVGGAFERTLSRRFGAGDALKALLAGVGFASIDKISDVLTAGFARAAESAKTIADETERAFSATKRLIDFRRTDEQKLAAARREQGRLNRELSGAGAAVFSAANNEAREAAQQRAAVAAADLQENAVTQAELQKKIDDEKKRRTEEIARQRAELEKATAERLRETMSLEEEYAQLQTEAGALGLQAIAAKGDELKALELLTAEQTKRTEAARIYQQIQKRNADEVAKAQKAEEDRQKKIADLKEKEAKAVERVQTATAELARQRDDARKFSPEDIVKTASGRRDTTATGLRAAQILRDEARARTLERSGGSETLFDARTQRNVRADARFFQSRALTARSEFGQLRSDERDPFAGAGKELTGAAAELKQAAAELKTVQVTVDAS